MPGAREQRWVHLLCGEPDVAALMANTVHSPTSGEASDLLARVTALENSLARLKADNTQLRQHVFNISEQLGIAMPDGAVHSEDLSQP